MSITEIAIDRCIVAAAFAALCAVALLGLS